MSNTIDLATIEEPTLVLKLKDGTEKSYPLLDLAMKLEASTKSMESETLEDAFAAIRDAFGIPELTPMQCLKLFEAVNTKVEELDALKKLSAPKPS